VGIIAQSTPSWQGRSPDFTKKNAIARYFLTEKGGIAQETAVSFSGFSKLSAFEGFCQKFSCGKEVFMVF
jgi:hypothetical protein